MPSLAEYVDVQGSGQEHHSLQSHSQDEVPERRRIWRCRAESQSYQIPAADLRSSHWYLPETKVIDTKGLLTEKTLEATVFADEMIKLEKNLDPDFYHTFYPKEAEHKEAIIWKALCQDGKEEYSRWLGSKIFEQKPELKEQADKLKKSALATSVIFRGDDNKYYEQIGSKVTEIELPFDFPSTWSIARLNAVCQLTDGLKIFGKQCLLDAKYLRGKSSETILEQGKLVYKGDNIMLVDGENSGEVFIVPQDGYMGSTFKQLWISSSMYEPYVLAFIQFYKETLRNSKKGAAIPHLNKELFYGLIIGIPPLQEQRRIVQKIEQSSQLLK